MSKSFFFYKITQFQKKTVIHENLWTIVYIFKYNFAKLNNITNLTKPSYSWVKFRSIKKIVVIDELQPNIQPIKVAGLG